MDEIALARHDAYEHAKWDLGYSDEAAANYADIYVHNLAKSQ